MEEKREMITSRTTLAQIQDYVLNDFDVVISRAEAREIKEAGARGLIVWTPQHLVIVNSFTITHRHINAR